VVDGWIRLKGWARIGVLISRLRILLDQALAKKIDQPGLSLVADDVVEIVRRLIEGEGIE